MAKQVISKATAGSNKGNLGKLEGDSFKPVTIGGQVFDFGFEAVDEVPISKYSSRGTDPLPFPWAALAAEASSRTTGGTKFKVPAKFWSARKEGDNPKPAEVKERLRRAFYAWRDKKKEDRIHYALSFDDQFTGKGDDREYIGVVAYIRDTKITPDAAKAA